ncbi:uncharacterized protein LOC111123649 [Crassostrea virginica]
MCSLTLISVIVGLSFSGAVRHYGSGYRPNRPERPTQGPSDPWSLILSGSKIPWPLDLSGPNMTIPEVPAQSPLTCEFGRLLDQQGSCRSLYMRNQATDCPEGFTCQTAYGLCCAVNNPCSEGTPYVSDGEAVSCDPDACPSGYTCTKNLRSAVCCPASAAPGVYPPSGPQPCPPSVCPGGRIPAHCRREHEINFYGGRCLCTRNICRNEGYN